jgi:hypothetical protein
MTSVLGMCEVAEAVPLAAALRIEGYFVIESARAYTFDAMFQSFSSEEGWTGHIQGQV